MILIINNKLQNITNDNNNIINNINDNNDIINLHTKTLKNILYDIKLNKENNDVLKSNEISLSLCCKHFAR
jgi:hypothetical protein